MLKRCQIRLDPEAAEILEKIAADRGISQSKAVNEIILSTGKQEKEIEDLRAAVAAARAAEAQGRIIEEILNSMLLGFTALGDKQYQPEEIHPIVSGAKAAEAQRRLDRMKRKSV